MDNLFIDKLNKLALYSSTDNILVRWAEEIEAVGGANNKLISNQ